MCFDFKFSCFGSVRDDSDDYHFVPPDRRYHAPKPYHSVLPPETGNHASKPSDFVPPEPRHHAPKPYDSVLTPEHHHHGPEPSDFLPPEPRHHAPEPYDSVLPPEHRHHGPEPSDFVPPEPRHHAPKPYDSVLPPEPTEPLHHFVPTEPLHHAPYPEAHEIENVKKAITSMNMTLESISALLVEPRRRFTDARVRHCLAFMRMELSAIVISLRSTLSSHQILPEWWPIASRDASLWVSNICDMYAVSQWHALVEQAARRCRCPHLTSQRLLDAIEITDATFRSYRIFQDPCRYMEHLTRPIADLGIAPYAVKAEAGGLHLIGIHHPVKKLLRWTMAADTSLRVISVVGSTGMGKTTLAMELHRQLRGQTGGQHHFQCHAMAQMSRVTDIKSLLQHILEQVSQTTALEEDEEKMLVALISKHLQDKRYFILIDGIRKISDWDKIKGAFPDNRFGSRIMITTSFTSIAWICCADSGGLVHEMKPLTESDSERLLLTKAFGSMDGCLPENVKVVCDEILRRCEGIPLFVTGMANWLKNELQLQQEAQKLSSTSYSVEQVPRLLKQFEQALSPTYNDLPYELRLLLLFMSMFPHGYIFSKDSFIKKWLLYEGLTGRKYMDIKDDDEVDAETYFSELVDRNIITRVARNKGHNRDEAEACQWQLSYYVLQFLAYISADKGFASVSCMLASTVAPEPGGGDKAQKPAPRRLALHHSNPNLVTVLQTLDLSQTRTLIVSGASDQIPLDKFIYLVVLDLEGWENLKDEDMLEICSGKMCLLVHLSIRYTQVSKLPRQIKELCNLRTLDISHTQISELPLEVCMLRYLWKLDLRSTLIKELPKHEHIKWRLEHILFGGDRTINSSETTAKVSERILLSENLKTMATIDSREHSPSFLESLCGLTQLRVLAITWSYHQCTDGAYTEAFLSSIKKWSNLKSLTIHCGLGCSMEFLSSFSEPPIRLVNFKVTAGRFASVPKWFSKLSSLCFVQITVCRLGTEDLKILKDLSKLQCLVLGLEFIPREVIMIESGGFGELITFSVDCPVPWLAFKEGAMQRLAYLELQLCSGPASREGAVPSGIGNLQSLSEVALHYNKNWCTDGSHVQKTIEEVTKEVAEHCNPIDLVINGNKVDVQKLDDTELGD